MRQKIIGITIVVLIVLIALLVLPTKNSEDSIEDTQNLLTNESSQPSTEPSKTPELRAIEISNTQVGQADRPTSIPSQTASKKNDRGFSSVLATENKLIVRSKGKAFELDGNLSSSILANDDRFFNVLENFSADEQESPDAMALADAYSDIFEQFAEEINDKVFRLQNFSCGHSLCLGSVSATPPSDAYPKFDAWSQFNDYINNTGETFNTSVRVTFMIGDELVEYRFFFSTDPAIHGITMNPPDDY